MPKKSGIQPLQYPDYLCIGLHWHRQRDAKFFLFFLKMFLRIEFKLKRTKFLIQNKTLVGSKVSRCLRDLGERFLKFIRGEINAFREFFCMVGLDCTCCCFCCSIRYRSSSSASWACRRDPQPAGNITHCSTIGQFSLILGTILVNLR